MIVYAPRACMVGCLWRSEEALDSLELELKVVVNLHVGAEI